MKKVFAAVLLLCSSVAANASFIGSQINCDIEPSIVWECDNIVTSVNANEIEFDLLLVGNSILSVDFNIDSLRISNAQSYLGLGIGELLTLTLTPNIFNPTDYALQTNVIGFDTTDIDFDGEELVMDLNQTQWSPEDYILLNFNSSAAAVSNAPTLLLMLIGFAALRKRLKSSIQ